jgi:ribosomal-protein-alanine N-acetyltransferase
LPTRENASAFFVFMRILETERLILKSYETSDKPDFIALFTDAAVMKYVGDGVLTEERAEAFRHKLFEQLYPQNFNIWAIFAKENSQYVGHAGIYPRPVKKEDWEFVYFLKQTAWGKGYATEIARRVIEFGFEELNLSEVFATVDDEHSASIGVMEKAGMKFKCYEFDDDGRYSIYSIQKASES